MLAAEALVAATGLWPAKGPSRSTILAASGILKTWSRIFSTFLSGERGPFKWTPPPEPEKLQNDILELLDTDVVAGWFENMLDAELAIEYAAIIKSGREYLATLWPSAKMEGIVARSLPPSRDQLDMVWTVTKALDDSDTIFEDLRAHSLTTAQVVAFRKVFPELSKLIDRMVEDTIADKIAKGEQFTWAVESQVKTLLGLPQLAPIAIVAPKASEPAKPPADSAIDFAKYETPLERRRL